MDDSIDAIRQRLKSGEVSDGRVALAAHLGHAGAREVAPPPLAIPTEEGETPEPLRWIAAAREDLREEGLVRIAVAAARATTPVWRQRPAEEVARLIVDVVAYVRERAREPSDLDGLELELAAAPWGSAGRWLACPCEAHAHHAQLAAHCLSALGVDDRPLVAAFAAAADAATAASRASLPTADDEHASELASMFGLERSPLEEVAHHATDAALHAARALGEGAWEVAPTEAERVSAAIAAEIVPWLLDPAGAGQLADAVLIPEEAIERARPQG